MKLKRRTSLSFFFLAPPVLALALAGVWLSVSAGIENLKYARVSSQVISAVARARAMRIRPNSEASYAQGELLKRLVEADGAIPLLLTSPGAKAERAMVNPWGKPTRLIVYPAAQALRIELILSRTACLKMLQLYAGDVASLGLLRVDVREQLPSALWRLVYEQPQGQTASKTGLDAGAIQAGCGGAAETTVSLTFSLKEGQVGN